MHEIELKLQVPAARRAAVDAAVAGTAAAPRMRLQAAYHDTPERTLAAAGLALRLRREGRQWVQTLKGAGDDGLTRAEHNVPRGSAAAMPAIDPALHAGTPVGDRLIALLGTDAALHTLYRTDIRRRSRALPVRAPGRGGSRVELAFDLGRIVAGESVGDVCELEIELLAGSPRAVIDTARRWLPRFGLWLDGRSKAERGDLLARGEAMAPARLAAPVRLDASMDSAAAWQAVLRNCADQILANASQIASGEHAPEHVHQLRVGLRRLRSALALFEIDHQTALADGATALFRRLGAARDSAVIAEAFGAPLIDAMRSAGLADAAAPALGAAAPESPVHVLRDGASQTLLLDLLAAMHPEPAAAVDDAPPDDGITTRLAARLNRWHAQVVADAKRYAELDDAARHRLRKRAKRLRYAVEFSAALFGRRGVRRYLKALRALQERLGAVSDAIMAIDAFAPRAPTDAHAMFALGWLVARREALIDAAAPELKAFTKVERFWKRKR
ncbi:MAG: CHAD domain-containing protein [Pseudomonadota bacterium]